MDVQSLDRHVVMGLFFYPRGGAAQCALYLADALLRQGVRIDLVSGSCGSPGERSHAQTFFGELPVVAVDYTPAIRAARAGADPLAEPVPLHPSYEDRPGVPDRIATAVSPALAEHLVTAWQQILQRAVDHPAPIFHLHHLTPMQEAVARTWPGQPIISHLHGTELAMLQHIAERVTIASALGTTLAGMPDLVQSQPARSLEGALSKQQRDVLATTRWEQWRYGEFWRDSLQAAAQRSARLIAPSDFVREEALRLLAIDASRVVVIPNGVDTATFRPRDLPLPAAREKLRHWLVDDPRGWDESGVPGSVSYTEDDLRAFVDSQEGCLHPILIFVGRFVITKRVPMLIRAYQRARASFQTPAPLLIWGGHPDEWEGEHPVTVARDVGEDGVFFTGWRGHDELAQCLNMAAVLVAPSVNEPFGLVYLEAMAAGVPAIATRSGGPLTIINTDPDQPTGWLVEPDDEDALVAALIEAVNDAGERARRAENACQHAQETFSWESVAERVAELYQEVQVTEAS